MYLRPIPLIESQKYSVPLPHQFYSNLIPQSKRDKTHSLESFIKIKWRELLEDPIVRDLKTIVHSAEIIQITKNVPSLPLICNFSHRISSEDFFLLDDLHSRQKHTLSPQEKASGVIDSGLEPSNLFLVLSQQATQ